MVITIKKRVLAIASAMLTLFVFVVLGLSNAPAAQADPCIIGEVKVVLVGEGTAVCVPEGDLPTITVTLPRLTTTVTLPKATVTKTRTIPKLGTTTTIRVPGPVRTHIHNVPGPVSTRTVFVDRVVTGARQTVTQRATITGPTVTSTVTTTAHTVDRDEIIITRTKAVGISIILTILGALLAVLLLWGAYTYGWLQGDAGNRRFMREFRDEIRFRD